MVAVPVPFPSASVVRKMAKQKKPRATASPMYHKTKMCKFNAMGRCKRGEQCVFAHSEEERKEIPDLFRTRVCPYIVDCGRCLNPGCTYAHSVAELRPPMFEASSADRAQRNASKREAVAQVADAAAAPMTYVEQPYVDPAARPVSKVDTAGPPSVVKQVQGMVERAEGLLVSNQSPQKMEEFHAIMSQVTELLESVVKGAEKDLSSQVATTPPASATWSQLPAMDAVAPQAPAVSMSRHQTLTFLVPATSFRPHMQLMPLGTSSTDVSNEVTNFSKTMGLDGSCLSTVSACFSRMTTTEADGTIDDFDTDDEFYNGWCNDMDDEDSANHSCVETATTAASEEDVQIVSAFVKNTFVEFAAEGDQASTGALRRVNSAFF